MFEINIVLRNLDNICVGINVLIVSFKNLFDFPINNGDEMFGRGVGKITSDFFAIDDSADIAFG